MPKSIIVAVTKQDIRRGRQSDCFTCPVALAIARALPSLKNKKVWATYINYGKNSTHRIELPRSATRFIIKFDGQRLVKPFNFRLHIS